MARTRQGRREKASIDIMFCQASSHTTGRRAAAQAKGKMRHTFAIGTYLRKPVEHAVESGIRLAPARLFGRARAQTGHTAGMSASSGCLGGRASERCESGNASSEHVNCEDHARHGNEMQNKHEERTEKIKTGI